MLFCHRTGTGEVGERNRKSGGIIYLSWTDSGCVVSVHGGVLVVDIPASARVS